jgi:superfamily II DNA or RNA helicase
MSTQKYTLRPYQSELIAGIYKAWETAQNVCAVMPTGAGKSLTFGSILKDHQGASVAIAHRRELVGQMSVTLAKLGVRHRIIAPTGTIREIVTRQMNEVGQSFYNANAPCAVAGVDTLVRRELGGWANQVTLWVVDESAHLTRPTKWWTAVNRFPNAKGLGVTATPERLDGKGLGRHADGVFDVMVLGPQMRWLIDNGYLSEYRIIAPESDIDLASVPVSETTGDYNPPALRAAAKRSHIVGDVVASYLKFAAGKRGITFCVSVDIAEETAANYRAAGVPAEVVSAETPELIRAEILRRFVSGQVLQLCNVDLFSEGVDVPGCEVVTMARPSLSYSLVMQQFGRALRPMGDKIAIIIDHVGNILGRNGRPGHGLPDAPRVWSLDRRERKSRSKSDDIPQIRACPACTMVYERYHVACPYCSHVPTPISRSAPEHVAGDLAELDPEVLRQLRGEIARIDGPVRVPQGLTGPAAMAVANHHKERQHAQSRLRNAIAGWAGWQRALGRSDSEGYRRFYLQFGIDVATAQTLKTADADTLAGRIGTVLQSEGVFVNAAQ